MNKNQTSVHHFFSLVRFIESHRPTFFHIFSGRFEQWSLVIAISAWWGVRFGPQTSKSKELLRKKTWLRYCAQTRRVRRWRIHRKKEGVEYSWAINEDGEFLIYRDGKTREVLKRKMVSRGNDVYTVDFPKWGVRLQLHWFCWRTCSQQTTLGIDKALRLVCLQI